MDGGVEARACMPHVVMPVGYHGIMRNATISIPAGIFYSCLQNGPKLGMLMVDGIFVHCRRLCSRVSRYDMPADTTWPAFAFTQESQWGRCLLSFLRSAFERSGSASTLVHYRQILTLFFTDPAKLPDAYSREDIEKFIHRPGCAKGRIGRPIAPGTINNRLSCLKSYYAYMASYTITHEQTGKIAPLLTVPPPTLGMHFLQREHPPSKSLSTEELHRFFAVIPRDTMRGLRDFALFATYFFTARRRSEIITLTFGELEQTTLIEANNQRRYGWIYHYREKGHKRQDRTAELPQIAVDAIFLYLEKSGRLATIEPGDPIFTAMPDYAGQLGYDPKRPLAPNTVWHAVKRYAQLAGLDPNRVSVHTFRHSSSRIRYENGADIREIQKLLNHRSLATTDIYLRELTTTADTGAKLLEKHFGNL